MSELAFLSPGSARPEDGFEPRSASPLARALAGADGLRDLSGLAKLEVRGELDQLSIGADVLRLTATRALIVCPPERAPELAATLPGRVFDLTAAFGGLELHGERALRRLTDLDLDALPAAGKVADVPAYVFREGDAFRIFFPQEYGHYVAEAVLDTLAGLA